MCLKNIVLLEPCYVRSAEILPMFVLAGKSFAHPDSLANYHAGRLAILRGRLLIQIKVDFDPGSKFAASKTKQKILAMRPSVRKIQDD